MFNVFKGYISSLRDKGLKGKFLMLAVAVFVSCGFFAQNVFAVGTLTGIAITTPTTKLIYTVGDSWGVNGMVVTGTYKEGKDFIDETETITLANITGFESSVPVVGQVLTITFGERTATYTIDVVAAHHKVVPGVIYTYTPAQPAAPGVVLGAETYNFANDFELGANGDDVKELQKRLTEEGLYTGLISGTFDETIFKALKEYQNNHGLPQTGVVDSATRDELNKGLSPEVTDAVIQKLTKIITILKQIIQLRTQLALL